MDKRLIVTLINVCQSAETRFTPGKALLEFADTYNLGLRKGSSIIFDEKAKAEIASLLMAIERIDVRTTRPESWDGMGRAESLNLAKDEKLAGGVVDEGRVRIKALRGRPLSVCDRQLPLPTGADLGIEVDTVLESPIMHDGILLVENKQTFNEIWDVEESMLASTEFSNPLVLYRGDAESGARADAAHRLITSTSVPVHAFVDFDPAGMVIATGLPRLDKLVSPDLTELVRLLDDRGLSDRFLEQLAATPMALEKLEVDPFIGPVWAVIKKAGKALPQEFFHRSGRRAS